MDWEKWKGKRVFIRAKYQNNEKVYSGVVEEVVDLGDNLFFISFIDKFDNWVTVSTRQLIEIREEKEK